MTELTIIQDGVIRKILAGLADSSEPSLYNGLQRSYIARCIEHVITFIKEKMTEYNITGIHVSNQFPKFPLGKNQNIKNDLQLPYIAVSYRGGMKKEIGIGRKRAETLDGSAYAFLQHATIEFDCFAKSSEQADIIAGWIDEIFQIYKLDELMQKGFINWSSVYSRPGYGFNQAHSFDFPNRMYYQFEVFRHLLYLETSFEVVWVKKDNSTGIINQIIFNEQNGYFPDFSYGFGLEYLLVEDLQFGWHNVFV